jgi:hypothetical protein
VIVGMTLSTRVTMTTGRWRVRCNAWSGISLVPMAIKKVVIGLADFEFPAKLA